ncbi:MAG: BlaI/MecI/CopY family transcriptional regulator [Acidimicrobiales bacterium]|nr:BlaI/MecI/CopY family transcriptional regulator [Acidimicrobiales bacterium]
MTLRRRAMGALEEHVMDYLWAVDAPASAADVQHAVAPELAYTTMTTVLTRLVDKGRLERARVGRSFVYSPVRSEAEHRAATMTDTLGAAVDRTAVLSRFIDSLATDDVDVLRRILDEDH